MKKRAQKGNVKQVMPAATETDTPEKIPEKEKPQTTEPSPQPELLPSEEKNPVPQPLRELETSGTHTSCWLPDAEPLPTGKLGEHFFADVVVVGGGIAGVTIAFNLVRAGLKVALIEDGHVGSGETGRTTAHLTAILDDRYTRLEKLYGEDGAKLIAESHRHAIDFIDLVVHNENIDCDFKRVPGYLFRHPTDDKDSLQKEYEAVTRAGLKANLRDDVPGIPHEKGPCLEVENQAQFHPLKYLQGLCNLILRDGGRIFTNTHAATIDENGVTTADGFSVRANYVVVATNTPVNNKYRMHLRQSPYRTYVIGARVRKEMLPYALWWDTGDQSEQSSTPPYHYVRQQPLDELFDLLIVGGEDHHTGESGDVPVEIGRYDLLEEWMRRRFEVENIMYRWSGQVLEPVDSLAVIGRNPGDADNVFIVTSTSGSGMTYGTIAGMIIPDLIRGNENRWTKVYEPSRFKLRRAGLFLQETVAGLFESLKTKKQYAVLSEVPKGEGKVVEIDGIKLGAYRDDTDTMHLVHAECTHLGCIIKWNPDEKSWDCPCHGSRFTHMGKVMNGPANKDLDYHTIRENGRTAVE